MLIIRADGNAKTGAGHLMRCLTIAEAAAEREGTEEILFLCADQDSAGLVRNSGFRAQVFGTDYRDMESELWAHTDGKSRKNRYAKKGDAGNLWDLWVTGSQNCILVDSYYVTEEYLEGLKRYGKVWLLDDMQDHAYPADGIINYHVFADPKIYERLYRDAVPQLCLGASYIPLRKQFENLPYQVGRQVRNILITTGGGDAENLAEKILTALEDPERIFHVPLGRFSPHLERWKLLEQQYGNVRFYHDVKDMAELMQKCDLAVTAGGSTLYELAAVGVPFVCFSCAGNQEALVEYMGSADAGVSAGAWHQDAEGTLMRISEGVERLCRDEKLRHSCSEKGRSLVDGQGAKRLAQVLGDL